MKNVWNLVSFLAVVNLVALAMFAGWLAYSDRLSIERLRAARNLFAPTLAMAADSAATASVEAEQARLDAADAQRRADPPLPSGPHVARTTRLRDQTNQAIRGLQDQTELHRATLDVRSQQLDEREATLAKRQAAWNRSIEIERERGIDAQFQKTVTLYEALAGKQAKRMLLRLVDSGEMRQAVAYIDAMNARAAAKTFKELRTEPENQLATELLEQLRTFGVEAEAAELPGDDDSLSTAR